MRNYKNLILIGLIIGFLSTISAQSYNLQYKWQQGDIYHYKLVVKSPQFGTQEFFYDQIVEKIYQPTDASFTFKTPLGTFKAKSADIQPLAGAAIVRIVYTKGSINGKAITDKELLKNLLLYIKPNGETYVLQRKQISGTWVFAMANVVDQEAKDNMRKYFKSPASVEYSISDNQVLTEYDPDGIFHPVYLPDNQVNLGAKWNFSLAGIKIDFAFDKMERIDNYNCALLTANGEFSSNEMTKGMPGMPEEMEMPEMSGMMPEINEHTTFYFEPDQGILVRVIDHTELKGPLNASFDSRLDLVGAELKSGQKVSVKVEAEPQAKFITEKEEKNEASGSEKVEIKVDVKTEIKEETQTSRKGKREKRISEASFRNLLKSIEDESFEDTRIDILEDAVNRNYFSCQQLIEILKLFSFENNKVKACKIVYPKLTDNDNFHTIYPSFTFSSSKTEIKEWIKKFEKGEIEQEEDDE